MRLTALVVLFAACGGGGGAPHDARTRARPDAAVAIDAARPDLSPGWTWIHPHPDDVTLLDGVWASGQVVIAVGTYGEIERSTDGGATWATIPPGPIVNRADDPDASFDRVWGSGDHWILAGAPTAIVAASHDGGVTWSRAALGAWAAEAVWGAGGEVYVVGDPGIRVSHDHGITWSTAQATGRFVAVAGTRDGHDVYAAGQVDQHAAIFHSSDRGRHFAPLALKVPDVDAMYYADALCVLDDGAVLAHLANGQGPDDAHRMKNPSLVRSLDRGRSWTVVPIAIDGVDQPEPTALWAGPGQVVYARVGEELAASSDSGEHWHLELDRDVAGMAFVGETRIAVGADGYRAVIGVHRP